MRAKSVSKSANSEEILSMLSSQKEGALATLEEGRPFVTLVGYLYERDDSDQYGKIYILMSDLARHTKHLLISPEASLLVAEKSDKNLYQTKRLTIKGRVSSVQEPLVFERLKTNYLKVFREAEIFFTLDDFKFYCLQPDEIYWVGGYGKVAAIK